jgi:hypothetical protein
LEGLGLSPLPTPRTIERLLERAGLSCPPLRLAPRVAQTDDPGPRAHATHQFHQVDVVGPRDLTGDKTRYYYVVGKDAFDQVAHLEFLDSREMEGMSPSWFMPGNSWGGLKRSSSTTARSFAAAAGGRAR